MGLVDCGKQELVAAGDMRPLNLLQIMEDSEIIRHPWGQSYGLLLILTL